MKPGDDYIIGLFHKIWGKHFVLASGNVIIAAMKLFIRFIDICLFRAGPADLPSSHWLMKVVLVSYFITGVMVSKIESPWNASLLSSLTDMLLMVLVSWLLLKLRGLLKRYQQTVTAMAGSGTILSLLSLPVLYVLHQVDTPNSHMSSIVLLFVMILLFWSLMVTAHIFRQALEIKPGTAAVITIIYTLVSLIVMGLVMSGAA